MKIMKKFIYAIVMLGFLSLTNSCTKDSNSNGMILLSNLSSNWYSVYVNGALTCNLKAYSDTTLKSKPVGVYYVRVLQITGYLLTPTDKTYTVTLSGGDIATVEFP
jgi:hypothetical protein